MKLVSKIIFLILIKFSFVHSKPVPDSFADLADKLNINRSNYYLWTSSRSVPKQSTINRLAELLNLKIIWHNKNEGEISEIEKNVPNIEEGEAKKDNSKI